MNLQNSIEQSGFHTEFRAEQKQECRNFPRFKIKRRILIRDPQGHILTGHAFDISRQGVQFRCAPRIAYQLEATRGFTNSLNYPDYEVKIALPYMNQLEECTIHCTVTEMRKADEENMRIGLSFLYFDEKSQLRLNHFIDNLTL